MTLRVLILLLAVLSPTAFAADSQESPLGPPQDCSFKKIYGYEIRWCTERGSPTSGHVVYYFHGIGGNELKWQNSSLHEAVAEKLTRTPELRPTVFSISFGRAWFFSDVKNLKRASRLTAFLELMPQLEASLPVPVTRRTVVGESMGGYNALRLTMEIPGSIQQTVALCPALLPVGPYSSQEDIEAFKKRNEKYLNVRLLENLRYWVMTEFPTQASWIANNPLDRSAKPIPFLPPIYLSQYIQDEFAFPEGTAAFYANLEAQHHTVSLRTVDGGHCHHSPEVLQEASEATVGAPAFAER
jgi:pimeloyl-ACP methyl ester carboxylesterase